MDHFPRLYFRPLARWPGRLRYSSKDSHQLILSEKWGQQYSKTVGWLRCTCVSLDYTPQFSELEEQDHPDVGLRYDYP